MPIEEPAIHAAVFDTVEETHAVIRKLREAGIPTEEISVLCSDEAKEKHFREYEHEEPAGTHASEAVNTGGAIGLGLGGAAVVTGLVTTGGTAIFAVGAFAGLAIVGTFASLMMTRGSEKELSDYYDQALSRGKLLVAVESEDADRRAKVDRVFQEAKAVPLEIDREV
ncbi:hypothetical protein Mal4_35720 [Maioricimonas rarisocia]|uniref:General stress protein 17M-like domain-containing protein n=1 Tax=Maioricimonas rarisocia TaxID=2528026 RepID=A0A517Z9S5_9PLAN|nr:hypothetical protein [Maioricimonas rarisocia]QDU39235.1 hypothetical protein Mal4_35720 [Maioricimonas rarisocia]